MEAVAATGPGCEAGKCSGPGGPGTGPDFGDFPESMPPAAVGSDLPEGHAQSNAQRGVQVRRRFTLKRTLFVIQQQGV